MRSLESLLHREAKTLCKGQTTRQKRIANTSLPTPRGWFAGRRESMEVMSMAMAKHGSDVNGNGFIHDNERFCFFY
ncbi:hypothetical protein EPI10_032521 [Gossypium australe]|uniref:Uncharacterized protein n=1 Tax=Gossypium australe TaxID=47621 RepID=A0A5B6X683_9ROSI|nr:hypothetical protein EPI10_032521 [Gossypium australe]